MRLIKYSLALLLVAFTPFVGLAADGAVSVRAIAFTGLKEKGQTDARLAPYQGILQANLRFESFRSAGESSITVNPGSSGTINAGGASVRIDVDAKGTVRAEFNNNSVQLMRAAVFNTGPSTGVIVMRN